MGNKSLSKLFTQHEFWLGLLVLLLVVGLSASSSEFMTLGNLTDVATSYAILGILACGLFVVLIAGGIDISFPAVTSIGQYVMASYIIHHGGSFPLAFAMSMGIGLLLGLVNGFLVYWLRVPAIIITIATLNLFYGLLVYLTNGTWLYGFPDWFMNGISWFSFTAADGYDYGLTLPLLCLLGVIIVTGVLMNRTRVGRQIYAMGSNRDAASRLGLNILRLHFLRLRFLWDCWRVLLPWYRRKLPSRWHLIPCSVMN
jgi:monosaccharide ABC transporter membrane protein, CUT2 family (TC 3.A.1.2.-)